eukprot:g32802.t1
MQVSCCQDAAVGTLQDNLQLLREVEAKSQTSLDAARSKESRLESDYLKLKNALEGKIRAMKQDMPPPSLLLMPPPARPMPRASWLFATWTGLCLLKQLQRGQDIKTAKEYLVQVERGCMEKAGQFQQQKKNRGDEIKAILGALKALRGVMNSGNKPTALSFLQLGSSRSKDLRHLALRKVQQLAVSMKSSSQRRALALNQLASKMGAVSRYGGGDVFAKMRKLIEPPSKRKEPNPTSMVAASKVADLAQNKVVVAGALLLTVTTALDVVRRWRRKGQQPPYPPGSWPFLGHFVTVMRYCWDNSSWALAKWGLELQRSQGG